MLIHNKKMIRTVLPLLVVLGMVAMSVRGGDQPSREYMVKSVFIRNFAQFVQWPADTFPDDSSPVIIGVLGADPFAGALELAVKDKKANGHPIIVKHFASVNDIELCHVLFVSGSGALGPVKEKLETGHVLLIGDSNTFTADGGMIRLFLEDDTVRFEVNLDATDHARLKLSSRLLQLAKIYKS